MAILSVVVQVQASRGEAVSEGLAAISGVNIYGIRDDQVVTVLEGEDMAGVDALVREIMVVPDVLGVFPVYGTDYENA
jgi:nitrate reductase NapAB chaperone NapD